MTGNTEMENANIVAVPKIDRLASAKRILVNASLTGRITTLVEMASGRSRQFGARRKTRSVLWTVPIIDLGFAANWSS